MTQLPIGMPIGMRIRHDGVGFEMTADGWVPIPFEIAGESKLEKPFPEIIPHSRWVELRVIDLLHAIERNIEAGEPIPDEWRDELNRHLSERKMK